MTPQNSNPQANSDSGWPVGQMLMRGTFGTQTPAERRLKSRSRILFGLMLVIVIAIGRHPQPAVRALTMFAAAGICTFYAVEKRKYFISLDELPRRIELEGMAWAYSLGLIAALWAAGVGYAVSLRWTPDPRLLLWSPFLLLAMFLATVKGAYRYYATRRYS
jgi:hypothetical protein